MFARPGEQGEKAVLRFVVERVQLGPGSGQLQRTGMVPDAAERLDGLAPHFPMHTREAGPVMVDPVVEGIRLRQPHSRHERSLVQRERGLGAVLLGDLDELDRVARDVRTDLEQVPARPKVVLAQLVPQPVKRLAE